MEASDIGTGCCVDIETPETIARMSVEGSAARLVEATKAKQNSYDKYSITDQA
jgi:hypothetical protein